MDTCSPHYILGEIPIDINHHLRRVVIRDRRLLLRRLHIAGPFLEGMFERRRGGCGRGHYAGAIPQLPKDGLSKQRAGVDGNMKCICRHMLADDGDHI